MARDSASGTRAKTVVSITGGGANMGLSSLWRVASLGRLARGADELARPVQEIDEIAAQLLEREAEGKDAPDLFARQVSSDAGAAQLGQGRGVIVERRKHGNEVRRLAPGDERRAGAAEELAHALGDARQRCRERRQHRHRE